MYKRIKSIIGLGLMFSLLLFVIACNSDSPQSTFDPHGPIAELQNNLFMFTFWIAVVVFIIVEGGIIYLTFKYRKKDDKLPVQTHGNLKLEITWTIIPAIIVVIIAIPTVLAIWETQVMPEEEDSLVIEAVGHQWWF